MEQKEWDIFLSHASEDDESVARPLTAALRRAGARVWLDEQELTVGDSLSEKIDEGLARSQFGAVILSPAFFAKHWPKKELAGLRAREEEGQKVILPVWHNIDKATISQFSPILSDLLAVSTDRGIDEVARKLLDVIFSAAGDDASGAHKSVGRRLIELLASGSDKKALVDFLRAHIARTGRYLGWGGESIIEPYQLYGVVFDAYAPYVGHGMKLTLVDFTEVWADPFETDQDGTLTVREEISSALAAIEKIQHLFSHDLPLQARIRNWLAPEDSEWRSLFERSGYFDSLVPELEFFVYAGRRSAVDTSPERHNSWSQLRDYHANISVRTYDNVIDAFL
jgi:hypothetical protein